MQGTRVWALVWEDPTCRGATRPVRHNYWACALEPVLHNEKPPQWEARTPQWKVAPTRHNKRELARSNEDPAQPKINK